MTGFNSKRDAAAAKYEWLTGCPTCGMDAGCDCDTAASVLGDQAKYGTSWSKDGERIDPMSVYNEPAQEPAEWSWVCNECGAREFLSSVSESDLKFLSCGGCGCDEFHKENTTPPQRPWVGLTDEQIEEMANDFEEGYVFLYRSYARAIEQALKEKNT